MDREAAHAVGEMGEEPVQVVHVVEGEEGAAFVVAEENQSLTVPE